jgi:hypothetical protein
MGLVLFGLRMRFALTPNGVNFYAASHGQILNVEDAILSVDLLEQSQLHPAKHIWDRSGVKVAREWRVVVLTVVDGLVDKLPGLPSHEDLSKSTQSCMATSLCQRADTKELPNADLTVVRQDFPMCFHHCNLPTSIARY